MAWQCGLSAISFAIRFERDIVLKKFKIGRTALLQSCSLSGLNKICFEDIRSLVELLICNLIHN